MERFTLATKYTYIALNNVEVISKSFKVIENYISIGLILDLINNGVIAENGELYTLNKESELTQLEIDLVKELKVEGNALTYE